MNDKITDVVYWAIVAVIVAVVVGSLYEVGKFLYYFKEVW